MGTGAPGARGRLFRAALVGLLLLVALLAPAAGTPVAATAGGGLTSSCAAPEAHEELRPGRPDRERPRPMLPRPERPAVEAASLRPGPGVPCAQDDLTRTRVEALPHPLDRIPIRRN